MKLGGEMPPCYPINILCNTQYVTHVEKVVI